MNLKAKFMNLFRENVNISKKISAGLLAFMIMLSPLTPIVNANNSQPNSGTTKAGTQIDVKKPSVNPVLYGATTISGANLAKAKVNKKTVIATVYVTLKGENGTVKATLSVTPTSGTKWSVKLPEGKKVEKGDTVTVYQQIGENKSPEVTANAKPSKASTITLKMPTGEIWIEQTSSNIVNEDEQAEAVKMLKDANTAVAGDMKSVKFTIDGTNHAYYEVTYTDGSTSGKVEATDLKIKQVTEYSRKADLNEITIVDNVVKGKLPGPGPFDGIKVQLIINVKKEKSGDFCTDKGCKIDKNSSKPVEVTLQKDGTFSYTLQEQNKDSLELDQIVGVSVKEPHKFVSCSTTTVKPVIPEKTEVKDPRKLTAEDKTTIINAIKEAYKAPDGTSKLPNGTGYWDEVPAVIQFDDSGNAKIFSGNDVAGSWDSDGHYVPEKNADGSLKVKEGAKPTITIPAKDLLKNIKPDAPTLALSDDKKNITITPNEKDTDANIITVSYTDKDGKDQTTTATKADDGTWSIVGEGTVVNGVITLPKDKVKGKTDVKAKVTDKGGVADDDKTPLTSDFGTLTVEETKKETKADKVRALGGLDPVVMKKWVKDKLDWKEGVKAKDDVKKDEVNNLLAGATFEDFQADASKAKRNTDKADNITGFVGKIKVKFDDDSELVVENQKLYVSEHVTWFSKKETPGGNVVFNKNTPDDALVVEFKLGEGTKVDNTSSGAIEGNKDNPVSYQKYKVKPNTDLKTYENQTLHQTYYNLINSKVKAIDKYTEPVWNGKNGSVTENFIITESNNVFTATATKTYDITFDANTGGGTKDKVTQKVNTEYELPASNTFTPPASKEFSGWQVGDDSTNLKQPGEKIKITGDTIVKAIWKDIEHKDIKYKVTFNGNNGTGSMDSATVKKGEKYKLPENTFGAPSENQEFKTWEVDGKEVAPGTEITIEKDTEVKAIWKDIMIKIIYNPNGGNWNNDSANKTIEVKKGTTITIMEAPVKDGFKFKYWKGSEYQPGDDYTAVEDHTFTAVWEEDKKPGTPDVNPSEPGSENKKPGTPDVNPSEPGSKDKNGTQSRGTSSLNSKNNRIPKTGVSGMNILYAFGLSFAACGALVINRISRKEK
ncbi:InlB B-repeat-containing protein [uncultured Parvimonas sp.]|uniref:InlB B-repeat-containing protein n=1 Tax=uncultured Parvimonas sp. TaxID=747372 RepID=UPI00288B48D1|nr:InlB B-repeat-containing protein [uncultured Parvimonas sp.]